MSRTTLAAVTVISLIALGACGRRDDNAYDTAGATAGAMATPAPIGLSVGATTSVLDSIAADSIRRVDSLRRRDTTKTP